MTPTQAQIEAAARELHGPDAYGNPPLHYDQLSERWKNEWRKMAKAALSAAAEVALPRRGFSSPGFEQGMQSEWDGQLAKAKAATIERCAQVAENYKADDAEMADEVRPYCMEIAAAIRAMKDET